MEHDDHCWNGQWVRPKEARRAEVAITCIPAPAARFWPANSNALKPALIHHMLHQSRPNPGKMPMPRMLEYAGIELDPRAKARAGHAASPTLHPNCGSHLHSSRTAFLLPLASTLLTPSPQPCRG